MPAQPPAPRRWATGLPHPIGFVLSGGASLGAVQVGMVQALADTGIEPDLVVGTSVGTLNGAVVAEHASLSGAAEHLERIWRSLRRRDVLPGNAVAQGLSVLRARHLHASSGIARLVERSLRARTFEDLARPLTIVTADVLTGHVRWFDQGPLGPPLLAATAIPGVFPSVEIDGRHYADAGPIANVPLQAAIARGAASLVVFDAGDTCHLDVPPRGIPDALIAAIQTAMRQRVLVEAPRVAEQVPVLYLPRPCIRNHAILDFDTSAALIEPTRAAVVEFLDSTDLPRAGAMAGLPHHHDDEAGP